MAPLLAGVTYGRSGRNSAEPFCAMKWTRGSIRDGLGTRGDEEPEELAYSRKTGC